jgi:hypothetical protein
MALFALFIMALIAIAAAIHVIKLNIQELSRSEARKMASLLGGDFD